MAITSTPRFGFSRFGAGSDRPVNRDDWNATVDGLEAQAAKFLNDGFAPTVASDGTFFTSGDFYPTGPRGLSLRVSGYSADNPEAIWRGVTEVVRLSDYIVTSDTDYTAAFRLALIQAKARKIPLYVNVPDVATNVGGTPFDFTGVHIIGIPGLTQITDYSVAGSTVFSASTATGVNCSIRNLRFANNVGSSGGRLASWVKILTTDNFAVIEDCEFGGKECTGGAVRIESPGSDANPSQGVVYLNRCIFNVATFGASGDALAATGIGVMIAGGERVVINDCSFSRIDESIRITGASPVIVNGCNFANPGAVYAALLAANGGVTPIGINLLSQARLTVQHSLFLSVGTGIVVASATGTATVHVDHSAFVDTELSYLDSGAAAQYPFIRWVSNHGQLSLAEVTAVNSDTAEKPVVRCEAMTGKFLGVRSQNCTGYISPAGAGVNAWIYSHDASAIVQQHSMFVVTSAGVPSAIVNV